MDFEAIDREASKQLGLITTAQLAALGATPSWIYRQCRSGRLIRVRRTVFRVAGAPETQDQAWLAAVLAADDAVLSHASAAVAWGLRGFEAPDRIDLLRVGSAPRLPGVRGHGTRRLFAEDVTRLRRIPVTSVTRTLVDASGRLHPWWLGRVVDDALRRKLVTLPSLVKCFQGVPVSGRRPSRAMKDVLAERLPGFHAGGSAAELDVMRVLSRARIRPLPVQQYRVHLEGRTYYLDYAWPDVKQAIEYDGGGGHGTVSDRHGDRERWRRLQRADWTVWPMTERTSESELVAIAVTITTRFAA